MSFFASMRAIHERDRVHGFTTRIVTKLQMAAAMKKAGFKVRDIRFHICLAESLGSSVVVGNEKLQLKRSK